MGTFGVKEQQYITAMRNAQVFANMAEGDDEILDVAYGAAARFQRLEKVWGGVEESRCFMFKIMNRTLRQAGKGPDAYRDYPHVMRGIVAMLDTLSQIDGKHYVIADRRVQVLCEDGELHDAWASAGEGEV